MASVLDGDASVGSASSYTHAPPIDPIRSEALASSHDEVSGPPLPKRRRTVGAERVNRKDNYGRWTHNRRDAELRLGCPVPVVWRGVSLAPDTVYVGLQVVAFSVCSLNTRVIQACFGASLGGRGGFGMSARCPVVFRWVDDSLRRDLCFAIWPRRAVFDLCHARTEWGDVGRWDLVCCVSNICAGVSNAGLANGCCFSARPRRDQCKCGLHDHWDHWCQFS